MAAPQGDAVMVYVQHQLRDEFPGYGQRFDELTRIGCGFVKLCAEYEFLNREINLIESRMNLAGEGEVETLRQQRQAIRDRIVGCLNGSATC
jgi:uncharacterized protein YdcH (DUF465 family)